MVVLSGGAVGARIERHVPGVPLALAPGSGADRDVVVEVVGELRRIRGESPNRQGR